MRSPSDSFLPGRLAGLLLVVLLVTLWCANLQHRVLQHPDEGRYAEIAREMTVTGNWLTPRLNGLKYFEKPPLQYWLTAATFEVFGVHEWTARLWTALSGLLGVAAIAWAGWRVGGIALGAAAGLALAGTLWQVALSQILTLDALLSLMLAAAFAAFVVAQRDDATAAQRRNAMWMTWAALAGATLAKGLVGILIPGAALVLYTLLTRDWALWRRLHLASGLALYLLIAAPWFVAVSLANREFAQFFFIHEHFQRFLTDTSRRTGSIGYFVPLFLAGGVPWVTIVLWNARRAWREGVPNALGFSWQRLALVWAAFVFVFFSVSHSKLPSYILPMFPPLALVTGWLLLRLDRRHLQWLIAPLAVVGLVLALAAWVAYPHLAAPFADDRQPVEALLAFGGWVQFGFTAAAVGGVLAVWLFGRGTQRSRFAGIAALSVSTLAATQLIVGGLDSFRTTRSAYDILRHAAAAVGDPAALSRPDVPFFQVHMYDQTVPFYLARTTTVVNFGDELSLGIEAEPERAMATEAEWIPVWTSLPAGYAMLPPKDYEILAAQQVPMRVLARDTRRVIVGRR